MGGGLDPILMQSVADLFLLVALAAVVVLALKFLGV
jgi:hypothetical protein